MGEGNRTAVQVSGLSVGLRQSGRLLVWNGSAANATPCLRRKQKPTGAQPVVVRLSTVPNCPRTAPKVRSTQRQWTIAELFFLADTLSAA